MRSTWRPFIQPENAIKMNWKGSRSRVIAEVTLSPSRNRRYLDLRYCLSDRVFGHYDRIEVHMIVFVWREGVSFDAYTAVPPGLADWGHCDAGGCNARRVPQVLQKPRLQGWTTQRSMAGVHGKQE